MQFVSDEGTLAWNSISTYYSEEDDSVDGDEKLGSLDLRPVLVFGSLNVGETLFLDLGGGSEPQLE